MTADVFGIVGTRQAGVFFVERVVAEGGFAVVYRALHEGFRAPVALKCLKVPETMSAEQRAAFLERFREEGELLFRLSALVPSVVRPLHVDVVTLDDGRLVPFLALEWLDGEGLDVVIDRRRAAGEPPMDLAAAVDLLQPAAAALAQAHHLPTDDGVVAVIHRDLKPENLFVRRGQSGPSVKILDFGIARTRSAATLHAGQVTQGAKLDAFTPGYAAPEQWMPKRYGQVGPWTDVFGLALAMVEVLSGKPAIEGDFTAMMGTTTDAGRRPTPRNEGVRVSDAVERAFAAALAVDPRARTQSIEGFWSALEVSLGREPSIRIAAAPLSSRALAEASARPPPVATPAPPRAPAAAPAPLPRRAPAALESSRPSPAPMDFDLAAPVRPRERGTMASPHDSPDPEEQRAALDLRAILRAPMLLVGLAVAVSVADWGYTRATGEMLALGTMRPSWITIPLAVIGIGLACYRIVAAL